MSRYIDAEGLNLYNDLFLSEDTINKSGVYVRYRAVANFIRNAPTADVAPVVHAHWVVDRYCSHCDCDIHDYDIYSKIPKYCPECGAKMDEKEKQNEAGR